MKKKKINLMFVNYSYSLGGIEVLISNMCRLLDRALFNISLCSFSSDNQMEDTFKKMDVPLIVLKKSEGIDLFLSSKIRALCRNKNIHVMHTHNATPWLYGVLSCVGKSFPAIVHTQHTVLGKEENEKNRRNEHFLLLRSLKYLASRTFRVVSIADFITQYLIKEAGILGNRISLIHNGAYIKGIPLKINVLEKRASLGLDNNSFVIGIVARLVHKKGHRILLEAFKLIQSYLPNAKLLIVGDGDLRADLENQSKSLGIGNDVIFTGRRMDIPELLQVMDVFILSSYKDAEGLPVAILEAMVSRVPVIATDSGGAREIVMNGKTGILVEPDNVTALAEAILKSNSEKELVEKMVLNAEERVNDVFNLENMVYRYSRLYQVAARSLSCSSKKRVH